MIVWRERWGRLAVKGPDCSRISKDFIDEERERNTDAWFRQEYLCEFVDDREGVLRELVEGAVDKELGGLF